MAKDSYNQSHLSSGGKAKPSGPVNMHKRAAMGEKVTKGHPNGAAKPDTTKKIGNAPSTY